MGSSSNAASSWRCLRYGVRPVVIHRSVVFELTPTRSATSSGVSRALSMSSRRFSGFSFAWPTGHDLLSQEGDRYEAVGRYLAGDVHGDEGRGREDRSE